MDRVISNMRCNHVTGSTLMKFSDEKWRELISLMGLRVHIREAFKKVIKAEMQSCHWIHFDEIFRWKMEGAHFFNGTASTYPWGIQKSDKGWRKGCTFAVDSTRAPKPPAEKTEKLVMHQRITSFFSKCNVLALSDESVQHDIQLRILIKAFPLNLSA